VSLSKESLSKEDIECIRLLLYNVWVFFYTGKKCIGFFLQRFRMYRAPFIRYRALLIRYRALLIRYRALFIMVLNV